MRARPGLKFVLVQSHSRPHRPRSFWSASRIATSGLVQHRKSAIHGLPVKFDKSDWLRIRKECSAHAQKIGYGQRSRFLVLTERSAASGDENGYKAEDTQPKEKKEALIMRKLCQISKPCFHILTFLARDFAKV